MGDFEQICGLCGSFKWCGRDCARSPKRIEAAFLEAERREAERKRYFAERERAAAVTELSPAVTKEQPTVTKLMDSVTKVVKAKSSPKSGKVGRPPLLKTAMTDAERMRRYRARKKAGGK